MPAELSPLLGGRNPNPAPDSKWYELPTTGATDVRITLQGDELLPEDKVLKKAEEFFDYLNPHLAAIDKTWALVIPYPSIRAPGSRLKVESLCP